MANKHTRKEHIAVRRKREDAQKAQNKKHLTKKQQVLVYVAAALVVLVVFLIRAVDYAPGSYISWFGNPLFVEENAMLVEIDDCYYQVGTWEQEVEGYTYDPSYSIVQDENKFEAYYTNNDAEGAAASVFVGVVAENTAEHMYDMLSSYFDNCSELYTYSDGKYEAQYFFATSYFSNEEGKAQRCLVVYAPSNIDSLVHFNINSDTMLEANLPADEELLAVLPTFMEKLTLK